MQRTSRAELDSALEMINNLTLNVHNFTLDHNAQGYRLMRSNEGREISPRLPAGEMLRWMNAFINGISFAIYANL